MPEPRDAEQQVRSLADWLDEQAAPVTLTEATTRSAPPSVAVLDLPVESDEAPAADLDAAPLATRASRQHRLVLAAAAVVAVLAIAGALVVLDGDDDTDVATDVTIPSTAADLTHGWERTVPDFPGEPGFPEMRPGAGFSLSSNGEELLAVQGPSVDAWTSQIGNEWTDEELASNFAMPTSAGRPLWDGDHWRLPVAEASHSDVIQRSGAGNWTGAPVWQPGSGAALYDLTTAPGGLAGLGTIGDPTPNADDDQPWDWTGASPPTAVWWLKGDPNGWADLGQQNVAELPHDEETVWASGIVTLGSTVIAYGEDGHDLEGVEARPVVWISDSGTWASPAIGPFEEIDLGANGTVIGATVVDDQVVLVGTSGNEPTLWTMDERGNVATFRSPTWGGPAERGAGLNAIASGPAGLVAVGGRSEDGAVAYTVYVRPADAGPDLGEGWVEVVDDDVFPRDPAREQQLSLSDVTAHGDGFVMSGAVGDEMSLWRWSPPTDSTPNDSTAPDSTATTGTVAPSTSAPQASVPGVDPTTDPEQPPPTGPAAQEQFANWQRWANAGIDDYTLIYGRACFCPPLRLEVTVVDDEVTAVTPLDTDGVGLPEDQGMTIDDFFTLAEQAIGNGQQVDVTYDPDLGYPTTIAIDQQLTAVDGGVTWSVDSFEPT